MQAGVLLARIGNSVEPGGEIGDQILHIFQADMQAYQSAGEVYATRWANGFQFFRLVSQDQGFKAAPGIGHAEVAEVIQKLG